MKFNNSYMEKAIVLAQKAAENNEVPVGAIIVDGESGKIISETYNRVESMVNPCAHAEMLAINIACEKLGSKFLNKCDLYVTLEPCPMCAYAISLSRIRRLFFAVDDTKGGGVNNGPMVLSSSSCHHKPQIYDGFSVEKSSLLLRNFFKGKR